MTIFEISVLWLTIAPSYYGLMYALWFIYGLYFLKKSWKYSSSERESLFLYVFLWVLLWWRLGYILFYNLWSYISDPLSVFYIWEWWMSFHWWVIWVVFATYLFSLRAKRSFLDVCDDIALIIPVGLFLWRIWNYLNKELLWFEYSWFLAVTTQSWSYFPSPLVEALLEWVCIFVVFHFILKRPRFTGQFAALFLLLYGSFRTLVEIFIRTPDPQIGYYFWFLSQWSLLSIPMVLIWLSLYYFLSKK